MRRLAAWTVAGAIALAAGCGGSSTSTQPAPVPTPGATPTPSVGNARYRVTFEAAWSAGTHPTSFPGNPHFSPLIGGTHSTRVVFWEPGDTATAGIEAMAEQGSTSPLDAEIQAAIAGGTAEGLIQGEGISPSPGSTSLEFTIGPEHPLVTLVSMVAPSPDWFVGVHGMSLLEGGDWVGERTVTLEPYDAGTDGGRTYKAPDADTMPREPIRRIEEPPLASAGSVAPLGTFTFVRLSD